ncbi:FGGY family carbohydrate kinase [Streptomyces sanglieri]|uniref:FGGY family carbohydrate kinase n=1 Tax=Streptomyces sanglieri TaxID=193460 RepID=A0ABW2WRN0_9ACTN
MTQTFPGAAARRGVLSIDEGTTGTRAGVVLDSGAAHEVFYRSIKVSHPDDLSVEQDPMEIWTATVEVARRAVGRAREEGIGITAVALSTQRATAMLWDRVTGRPLLPAVVWQDRRYAADLTSYEAEWDTALLARQGRPVGARAPFLWAARQIAAHPEVAAAHREGRLLFGTVDTWLIWRLTGGAVHATTPTNAASTGGYLLQRHAWDEEWIGHLGFPSTCCRSSAPTTPDSAPPTRPPSASPSRWPPPWATSTPHSSRSAVSPPGRACASTGPAPSSTRRPAPRPPCPGRTSPGCSPSPAGGRATPATTAWRRTPPRRARR